MRPSRKANGSSSGRGRTGRVDQEERPLMAKVPFRREIDDLFASDRSIVLKLLGGAFVGGLVSLRAVLKDPKAGGPDSSTPVKVTIVSGAAVVGMLVVLLLSLRDVVVRRV